VDVGGGHQSCFDEIDHSALVGRVRDRVGDRLVVLVSGTRGHTEALHEQAPAVISPMASRLSEEKTVITHIDEGFDFLGFHIQQKPKEGTRRTRYTYPSRTALAAVKAKVRVLTQVRSGTRVGRRGHGRGSRHRGSDHRRAPPLGE
jgi:hypothetical protein